jgi:hypothetical protein
MPAKPAPAHPVVGKWNLLEVEWLPRSEEDEDYDDDESNTLSAKQLGQPRAVIEFAADGSFRGNTWGAKETGSWSDEAGELTMSTDGVGRQHHALELDGDRLVRDDYDPESGRQLRVGYVRSGTQEKVREVQPPSGEAGRGARLCTKLSSLTIRSG